MSIDRRIVSILYHNGIFDIEDVEKFVGEKDNYYEIIIDGELKKLQIPGYKYDVKTEYEEKIKIQREEIAETLSQIVNEDGSQYVSEEWVKKNILRIESEPEISFEEEMKKTDDENDAFLEKINEMEVQDKEDEVKEIFETPELDEVVKEIKENKKLIVTKTEVKVTKPKTQKNTIKKKPDDDIDDFMNTI
jgi:hypothetical protein